MVFLQRGPKLSLSHVAFKSFLRNLAPVNCINIHVLRHTKSFKISLDTTCVYISTVNTIPSNTDTKVSGHITQKNDRGWLDKPLYQVWCQSEYKWVSYKGPK